MSFFFLPGAKPEKAVANKAAADAVVKDKKADKGEGDFKITPRAEAYMFLYYMYISYV